MTAQSLGISSVDHITIIVSDLEQTRRFYVDLLGMSEVPRPDFDFEGKWFESGTSQIHATITSDLAGLAGWGDRQVKRASRGHHFAFQVEDAIQAAKFLRENEIEIVAGPQQRPDGPTQVYVNDPDGHVIEFFSR